MLPPPVLVVSLAKGTTQRQQYSPSEYRQLGEPGSTSFIQSDVQQRHTYQQRRRRRRQAYSGHARSPTTYSETQDEDEDEEEEESEEEFDSDEDDDEGEEQPDYNPQNKRQKYTRAMARISSGAGVPSRSLSRGYDENFEEEIISTHQQPQFGRQQTHGRQVRPPGGLICGGCDGSIMGRIVSAMGSRWHPACFRCTVCNELLEHVSSYEHEGRPYCHLDYHENFAPRCYSCKTAIIEEQFINLNDPALGKRTKL